ncbi:NUDIX hydrolase [Massilibacteroides vaginae]|uniref:NUDIX hydrolase n=1 Tax=Massilibacteroides vaginae TaxID=1673718 RepID=UPI000A1C8D4E|nr:NUDIX hydrolase [Massilibacteroides vaginae]
MKSDDLKYYTEDNIHPGFSVDCVLLSFHKGKIKVLLRKFALDDYYSLLGGFMFNHEDANQAAHRILEERSGIKDVFLKQFYLFSDPNRTITSQNKDYLEINAESENEGKWLLRRFISMGYVAIVQYDKVVLSKDAGETLKWYDINKLPPLQSDHANIIEKAMDSIRMVFPVVPVGYELLPEKFTMTDLRKIYEIFLKKKLDRRNFQRKILANDCIEQLDETVEGRTYNPSILYRFKSPDIGLVF